MQAIWPESSVEEANITVLISSLRKALGEREADEPYIKTVPKKGYRFTAPVRTERAAEPEAPPAVPSSNAMITPAPAPFESDCYHDNGAAPVPHLRASPSAIMPARMLGPALVLIACSLVVVGYLALRRSPPQHSLAVLPLENLTHDPGQRFSGILAGRRDHHETRPGELGDRAAFFGRREIQRTRDRHQEHRSRVECRYRAHRQLHPRRQSPAHHVPIIRCAHIQDSFERRH